MGLRSDPENFLNRIENDEEIARDKPSQGREETLKRASRKSEKNLHISKRNIKKENK